MSNLSEIRVGIAPFLSRAAGALVPDIPLRVIDRPILSHSRNLETKGRWAEAANHFHTVYFRDNDPVVRLWALIELSQMRINCQRLNSAEHGLLSALPEIFSLDEGRTKNYLLARVLEKLAWIADYRGDFKNEAFFLSNTRAIIGNLGENKRRGGEKELYSTATHFLGRAYLNLANLGIDRERNLKIAKRYFNEDLKRYERMREEGTPRPGGEGFQHAWLARCYLVEGDLGKAEQEITHSGRLFSEHVHRAEQPGEGILAHYHVLFGLLLLHKGHIDVAKKEFQWALKIRFGTDRYPKGIADAYLGLASASLKEGRIGRAGIYFLKALEVHPQSMARGLLGG